MKKRGISPLIATVLIIGFTVALAAVILLWGKGFIEDIQERTGDTSEKAFTCAATRIKVEDIESQGVGRVSFVLENAGRTDVESFIVRVTGDAGTESVTLRQNLKSAGKKVYSVDFDYKEVGGINRVEVIPSLKILDKLTPCAPGLNFDAGVSQDILDSWDLACGDGDIDNEWEECDPNKVPQFPSMPDGTLACTHFGYNAGDLVCNDYCTIDVSGCEDYGVEGGTTCGNGAYDGNEGCDFVDGAYEFIDPLIGTCTDLNAALGGEYGFTSGLLYCDADCMIDISQCGFGDGALCPNGDVDVGEVCDGLNLNGESCGSLLAGGFGTLACEADCLGFDTSGCKYCGDGSCDAGETTASCPGDCPAVAGCGNGVVDSGEECDGEDLGGETCGTLGFVYDDPVSGDPGDTPTGGGGPLTRDPGTTPTGDDPLTRDPESSVPTLILACNTDCTFDVSGCTVCGNNVREGSETCDGTDLVDRNGNLRTCASEGYVGGTLVCEANCLSFDTTNCNLCGNNIVNIGEQCDGTNLNGRTCASWGESGTLSCRSDCTYNRNGCYEDLCGNDEVDGIEQCDCGLSGTFCNSDNNPSNFAYRDCENYCSPMGPVGKFYCTDTCTIDKSACSPPCLMLG